MTPSHPESAIRHYVYYMCSGSPAVLSMATEGDAWVVRDALLDLGVDVAPAGDPRIWNMFPIKPTLAP